MFNKKDSSQSFLYQFKFPETFEIVFPASKKKWILVGLICIILGFGGFLGIQSGEMVGWIVAILFGLGLVLSIIQLLPGAAYLKIGPKGLEYKTMFRARHISWTEINSFGTYRQASQDFVGINYNSEVKSFSQNASLALVGFDDGLPDTYGHRANELAVLLTASRSHFLKNPTAPAPTQIP